MLPSVYPLTILAKALEEPLLFDNCIHILTSMLVAVTCVLARHRYIDKAVTYIRSLLLWK